MAETVAFYFGADPALGLLTLPPVGASLRRAVLLCPPWGWGEVASYRSRRRWAEALAEAGHPTLRFSYPGTGDSAGHPGDASLVDSWLGTLEDAVAGLRESFGAPPAVIGLGLGGLLARGAIARGVEVESLVLWAAPASGRAFAREARAFAGMQEWADEETGLEPGWVEAGGFLLAPEVDQGLRELSLAAPAGEYPRRVLLLDRDGGGVSAKLESDLEADGAAVTSASGFGWGELVSHPERSRLASEVVDVVESWLREAEPAAAGGIGRAGDLSVPSWGRPELRIERDGRAILERPLTVKQSYGRSFGVLATPEQPREEGLCVVFLNAGAVRRTGPNRLWVEMARRGAARGVPCLRIDLEAIGDADGDEALLRDVAAFYRERYEAQVMRVLDELQGRGLGDRFLLVGLCAGAFWSFRTALRGRPVEAALLLNAGALIWHENILAEREVRKVAQARQWSRWKRLLTGRVDRERMGTFLRSLLRRSSWRGSPHDFEGDFRRLREQGVRLTLAFAAQEPLAAELEREGVVSGVESWPDVSLRTLPGSDHTLRPLSAQRAALDLFEEEMGRSLETARSRS